MHSTKPHSARRRVGRRSPGPRGSPVQRLAACAGLTLCAIWPAVASAQVYGQLLDSELPLSTVTGRNAGVRDRVKPELLPVGQNVGGFRLFPSLATGLGFTSNVVGASVDARSDAYAAFSPQLIAQSQWGRHSLTGTFNYAGARYFNTSPKNEDGFLAQIDGKLDVHDMSTIVGSASYRRTYEDQQEASFPAGGGGAVAVDQAKALVRGTYVVNRLRWTLGADYNNFRYQDTISTSGARLDLSFRNRDVYRGSVRLEYNLGKDNSVFGQFTFRRTDYQTSLAANDRTSNEWRAMVGAIADVANLLRVAGAVGYLRRDYANPAFRPIGSLAVDLRADYYLTPLTTISAIASRQIEEASVTGSSGYLDTRFGARIDHELLRNLILYAFVDRFTANFRGIDRHDRNVDGGAGADYTLNRAWSVRFQGEYVTRVSSGMLRGPDIDEFRALATLKYQL